MEKAREQIDALLADGWRDWEAADLAGARRLRARGLTDFTVDELLEITKRRLSEYEYQFTQPAWQKFKEVINSAYQVRDPQSWGNARFVANQLERIYIQHAQRCVKEPPKDKAQIRVLIPDDITPIEVPRPKPRIGF